MEIAGAAITHENSRPVLLAYRPWTMPVSYNVDVIVLHHTGLRGRVWAGFLAAV